MSSTMTESVYVGRHPIYDRHLNVHAYELLYRGSRTNQAGVIDGNTATSHVLINTFLEIGLVRLTDHHPAFINLTRDFFLDPELSLPVASVVLEVLEDIDIDDEFVRAIRRLRERGYSIALDDFAFEEKWDPLLELADYIKVELPAVPLDELADRLPRLRRYNARLLAEKVETHEEFERVMRLGFHYFQGYFFCKPNVVEGKRVTANVGAVFSLLARLQKPDVAVDELEMLVSNDASVAFKLLRYLNSAHFGLGSNRFRSIRQAIVFLGVRQLRSWVALLAVCGIKGKPSELSRMALRRARQCEQFCVRCMTDYDSESFFMAGLFSVLDAQMDLPMAEVLQHLPVSEDIKEALLERTGRIGAILDAVIEWELGNPIKAETLPVRLGSPDVSAVFLEALFWADEQWKGLEAV